MIDEKHSPNCSVSQENTLNHLNKGLQDHQNTSDIGASGQIRVINPLRGDTLRFCRNIMVYARVIYAKCFLTDVLKKQIVYLGCEKTENYPPSNCVKPTIKPPQEYTYVSPESIRITAR